MFKLINHAFSVSKSMKSKHFQERNEHLVAIGWNGGRSFGRTTTRTPVQIVIRMPTLL